MSGTVNIPDTSKRHMTCSYEKSTVGSAALQGCPLCGGSQKRIRREWLLRCDSCGFLSSSLRPSIPEHTGDTQIDERHRAIALDSMRRPNYEQILDHLSHEGSCVGGRLLDVGCAHGWFLQAAQARGFDAVGIEPDLEMFHIAKNNGMHVYCGYFPDQLPKHMSFDVIVFNDVLEHLPNVSAIFADCRRLLKQDGRLVVNLPNSRGFFYRAASFLDLLGIRGPLNRLWQYNFPSPHLSYFEPDLLQRLAAESGFESVFQGQLPSVRFKGLWSRLRYDRAASLAVCAMQYAAVAVCIPLLRALPSDISLHIFRPR